MDQQAFVISVLEEFYPDETDIAGPANVRRLAAGARESIRMDGGSSLDMAQVLGELQSVVIILYASIAALQSLRRSSPGAGKPQGEIRTDPYGLPEFSGLDPDRQKAIVDRVVEWVKENPEERDPRVSGARGGSEWE